MNLQTKMQRAITNMVEYGVEILPLFMSMEQFILFFLFFS